MRNLASWASGIRTREYSSQSAVPYHLAIAHYLSGILPGLVIE